MSRDTSSHVGDQGPAAPGGHLFPEWSHVLTAASPPLSLSRFTGLHAVVVVLGGQVL